MFSTEPLFHSLLPSLHQAAQEGNLDVLKQYIESGVDCDQRNSGGQTPLILAAEAGHLALVKYLLHRGAKLNYKSKHGGEETALIMAANSNHLEVVRELLEHGADPDASDNEGISALMTAASWGYVEILACLLKTIDQADNHGNTALLWAAKYNQTEATSMLLARGADVSLRNYFGKSALLKPKRYEDQALIELLISAGCDVNAPDASGVTPLIKAIYEGHKALAEFLLHAGALVNVQEMRKVTPLMLAAERGFDDVVAKLLAAGANINDSDWRGFTALHYAASNNYVEVIDKLILAGANLEAKNEHGSSALICAFNVRYLDSVKRLLIAGSECEPSMLVDLVAEAVVSGSIDELEFFINMGADINAPGARGMNALMIAVSRKNSPYRSYWDYYPDIAVVRLLIENGANVNVQTASGMTALHYAIEVLESSTEIVALLLTAGAKVNAVNNQGKTPLILLINPHWDCGDGPRSCYCQVPERQAKAKLLLAHGADLYIKDNAGKTVIDYAHKSPMLQRWLIHEYAWRRRRHAVCFYARHHHAAEPAITASL